MNNSIKNLIFYLFVMLAFCTPIDCAADTARDLDYQVSISFGDLRFQRDDAKAIKGYKALIDQIRSKTDVSSTIRKSLYERIEQEIILFNERLIGELHLYLDQARKELPPLTWKQRIEEFASSEKGQTIAKGVGVTALIAAIIAYFTRGGAQPSGTPSGQLTPAQQEQERKRLAELKRQEDERNRLAEEAKRRDEELRRAADQKRVEDEKKLKEQKDELDRRKKLSNAELIKLQGDPKEIALQSKTSAVEIVGSKVFKLDGRIYAPNAGIIEGSADQPKILNIPYDFKSKNPILDLNGDVLFIEIPTLYQGREFNDHTNYCGYYSLYFGDLLLKMPSFDPQTMLDASGNLKPEALDKFKGGIFLDRDRFVSFFEKALTIVRAYREKFNPRVITEAWINIPRIAELFEAEIEAIQNEAKNIGLSIDGLRLGGVYDFNNEVLSIGASSLYTDIIKKYIFDNRNQETGPREIYLANTMAARGSHWFTMSIQKVKSPAKATPVIVVMICDPLGVDRSDFVRQNLSEKHARDIANAAEKAAQEARDASAREKDKIEQLKREESLNQAMIEAMQKEAEWLAATPKKRLELPPGLTSKQNKRTREEVLKRLREPKPAPEQSRPLSEFTKD